MKTPNKETTGHTPGVREARNGQFVPTINGKDTSPTSFDRDRALEIAKQQCAGHTPGPWHVLDHGNELIAPGDGGAMVAKVVKTATWPRPESEHAANARLIAAAPDLLQALESCEKLLTDAYSEAQTGGVFWRGYPLVWNEARAAIAKATGKAQP